MKPEDIDAQIREIDKQCQYFAYPDYQMDASYAPFAEMVVRKLKESRDAMQELRVKMANVKTDESVPVDPEAEQRERVYKKIDILEKLCDDTPSKDIVRFSSWSNWDKCPHIDLIDNLRDCDRYEVISLSKAIDWWGSDLTFSQLEEVLDWAINEGDRIVKNDW